MTSSRIEAGTMVPLGRPYLEAASVFEEGGFFGEGDDGLGEGGGASDVFGDDATALLLRGIAAYTVSSGAGSSTGFVLTGTVWMDATIDFVVTLAGSAGSSCFLASSSLSANKSSSSPSEASPEAVFSSLDMVLTIDLINCRWIDRLIVLLVNSIQCNSIQFAFAFFYV